MDAWQWASWAVDILVILMLVGVTFAGVDAWPFSAYPMFSAYRPARPGQRYFNVWFHFPDGRVAEMPRPLEDLLEAFQAEFARAWEEAAVRGASTHAVVQQLGQRARERWPALRLAHEVEVELTFVRLGARRGLSLARKNLGVFALPPDGG